MHSGTSIGNLNIGDKKMKKIYESAEMNIVVFDNSSVIVASAEDVFEPSYVKGDDETEIL